MKVDIARPIRTGFLLGIGASLAFALIFAVLALPNLAVWNVTYRGDDEPLGILAELMVLLIVSGLSIALVRSKPSASTPSPAAAGAAEPE